MDQLTNSGKGRSGIFGMENFEAAQNGRQILKSTLGPVSFP
jgi:hypothetical protein